MFYSGQLLLSPADFDNAMFTGVNISVWQHGEMIEYGGPITKHTKEAVYIQNGYFLKANFQFKVR